MGLASRWWGNGSPAGDDPGWSERMTSHTGTETRSRLLQEAAVGNITVGEKPDAAMPRVEEGLRVVKVLSGEEGVKLIPCSLTLPQKKRAG